MNADEEEFVSLKYLSNKIQIEEEILLDLLDELPVKVNSRLPSASKLPKMIDIGFNVVRRYLNEIVPELVRINEANDSLIRKDKYEQFK